MPFTQPHHERKKAISITIRNSMCKLPLIQNLQAQTLAAVVSNFRWR